MCSSAFIGTEYGNEGRAENQPISRLALVLAEDCQALQKFLRCHNF